MALCEGLRVGGSDLEGKTGDGILRRRRGRGRGGWVFNSFLTSQFTLTITLTFNLTFILNLDLIKTVSSHQVDFILT